MKQKLLSLFSFDHAPIDNNSSRILKISNFVVCFCLLIRIFGAVIDQIYYIQFDNSKFQHQSNR